MDSARTTVVVTTRNRVETVLYTVRRLLELRPRPPVIVLDEHSHDGTVSRLHELRDEYPQVRVVRMRSPVPAVARNLGADLARTPFVAFCADDTWWEADALSTAEAMFDAYDELGVITARVSDSESGLLDPLCSEMAELPVVPRARLPGPVVLRLHTGAVIVRREAHLRVGGFDPMLHLATEERLLAYDFAARGWQVCYLDSVRAVHTPRTAPEHGVRSRSLAMRDDLVMAWMRRPARECVRATARLLSAATHDPAAMLAVPGAVRRFAWAMVERDTLPREVEHRIRTGERAAGSHG